jgi:hypothetical protein
VDWWLSVYDGSWNPGKSESMEVAGGGESEDSMEMPSNSSTCVALKVPVGAGGLVDWWLSVCDALLEEDLRTKTHYG